MKNSNVGVLVVLAVALSACGKSKVEQCNAFVDRATQSQKIISGLKLDSEDPAELEKGATSIEGEAKAFGALELKDEKLVGFRSTYAGTLGSLSKVLHDLAGLAKDSKDPAKVQALEAQSKAIDAEADRVAKQESDVVDQVNQYCTGSK